MALVQFKLEDIPAFSSKDDAGDSKHFCVDCAREANQKFKLIPYLDNQLDAALSQSGQGAAMLCDLCGRLIATHYPEDFWQAAGT
jgi:hypothetical protein